MSIKSRPVNSTKPLIKCLHSDQAISIAQNEKFNISMYIIDSQYQIKIPQLAWTVIKNSINFIIIKILRAR